MRILSGIRPSGQLHLGNYLGAIRQWIELQNDNEMFTMVADLHALTTPSDPKTFQSEIHGVVADYLAAGLDPAKATIFVQSLVPAHSELMWILATLTPIGELERMTQYKDKLRSGAPANAGLLTYPVLMAADILLYQADGVPVGDDQVQHVELARVLARKFNRQFGQTFPEPKPLLSAGRRIMSLREPTKKMSKSGDEGIALSDEPATIERKLSRAVTATSGGGKNPGVENLLTLLRAFSSDQDVSRYETAERQGTIKYAELKRTLARDISTHFTDFRKKRSELLAQPAKLDRVLTDGSKRARAVAKKTLADVQQKIGLAP